MRALLALLFVLFLTAAAAFAQNGGYNYYSQALQGDLSGAEAGLKAGEDDELYNKFKTRFLKKQGGLSVDSIEDEGVRAVARAYQDYWRAALLKPADRPGLDAALMAELRGVIDKYDVGQEGDANVFISEAELARFQADPEAAKENIEATSVRLVPWIEKRGLFALTGRTSPLLEFMLWRETRRVETQIELTDGVASVPVIYLEDFISGGWAYFATFERSRAGGWAKADGIYVVADAYSHLDDESFTISYLKHEARHFVDATRYPKLSSADREYRAKLTELVYAQESLGRLLAAFAHHGVRVDVPHPLANWQVIQDLEARLFEGEAPAAWWSSTAPEKIRAAASALLEEHTAKLEAQGGETAEGVVRI